jgi:hypothetical protein
LERTRQRKVEPDKRDAAIKASLTTPWGLLGVLAPKNQQVVYPTALHRPILRAVVNCWETLDGIGPRYTVGLREGKRLWDLTTNLQYVLGQVGVDVAQFRVPLPPAGLRGILPTDVLEDL